MSSILHRPAPVRSALARPAAAPSCVAAALALFALLATPWAEAARPVEQRVAASQAGAVKITNVAGRIDVRTWNKPEVLVTGTIGTGVERLDVLRDGADVVVRVVLPKMSRNRDGDAQIEVTVPAGARVEATAVSADVEIGGAPGAVQARTVSGDLAISSPDLRSVDARSVSGDVSVTRGPTAANGELRLSTVSGTIVVLEANGAVDAQSVSGDIRAELGTLRMARLKSTSGDIELRCRAQRGAELEAETTSGNVEIRVPTAGRPSVDAASFSGDVTVCGAPDVGNRGGHTPGRRVELAGDPGVARIRARSMSGDIVVCDK